MGGIPGGILGTLAALALLIPLSLATGPGLNQLLKHMMRMRWNMNGRDDQSRAERMTSEWFDRTNLGRILKGLNQVNDTVNRWVFTNIVKPFNQWLDGALGGIDWKAADEGKLLGAIVGGLTGIIAGAIPGATIGLLNPVNLLDALLGGLVTVAFCLIYWLLSVLFWAWSLASLPVGCSPRCSIVLWIVF